MDNMIRTIKFPALFGGDVLDQFIDAFNDNHWVDSQQVYPTDIVEVKDGNGIATGYEIIMALAGIPKENIDVSIEDDTLNISVSKVIRENDNGRTYIKTGIARRSANVAYALHGVDKGKITSAYENGVLTVKIPLAEEAKPRKITIG